MGIEGGTTPGDEYALGRFTDDLHALYCGWVAGTLMRAGMRVQLVQDERDNYLDHFILTVTGGAPMVVTVPPPPAGWSPPRDL